MQKTLTHILNNFKVLSHKFNLEVKGIMNDSKRKRLLIFCVLLLLAVITFVKLTEVSSRPPGVQARLVYANGKWVAFWQYRNKLYSETSDDGLKWHKPKVLGTDYSSNIISTWAYGPFVYVSWLSGKDNPNKLNINRVDSRFDQTLDTCSTNVNGFSKNSSVMIALAEDSGTVYSGVYGPNLIVNKLNFPKCDFKNITPTVSKTSEYPYMYTSQNDLNLVFSNKNITDLEKGKANEGDVSHLVYNGKWTDKNSSGISEIRASNARTDIIKNLLSKNKVLKRGKYTLIFDDDPKLIYDDGGVVKGIDALIRLFKNGVEQKIDPHRVSINPPLFVKADNGKFEYNPAEAYENWLWQNVLTAPNPHGFRTRGTVTTIYGLSGISSLRSDSTTYATGVGAGGGSLSLSLNAAQARSGQLKNGTTYEIYENLQAFDTSIIQDNDQITAVDFSLYLNSKGSNNTPTSQIRGHDWGPSQATSDWIGGAAWGALPLLASIPNASMTDNSYNTYTSQAAFTSYINKAGVTYFSISSDKFGSTTAPTGNPGDNINFSSSSQTGTSEDPMLVITHNGPEEDQNLPVGFWKFDEATGNVASSSGYLKVPASLFNFSSPPSATSGWRTPDFCISGNCLLFSASSKNAVKIGDNVALDPSTGITIEAWVRANDWSGNRRILQKGNADNQYRLLADSSTLKCHLTGVTNGEQTTDLPSVDDWHHIVCAYDQNSGTFKMYVDGKVVVDIANASGSISTTTDPLVIGAKNNSGTSGDYMNGFIDEVKVFDYYRTPGQVLSDYNARGAYTSGAVLGASANMPSALSNGLIAYWKLDEASGDASDFTGSGNSLTNQNTTPYNTGKFYRAPTFNGSNRYLGTSSTVGSTKSVAFWVNPGSTTDRFINLASGVYISASSGTISATGVTNANIYVNGVLSSTITSGTWQHVVVTTDTAITANSVDVGRANGTVAANNTQIDDVRVYNRQLPINDVITIYNWAPGPFAYWNMENQGTTVNEVSGNGFTAGSWNGTPRFGSGKFGQATSFTGSDSSYVDLGQIFTSGNDKAFTYEVWVKANALPADVSGLLGQINNPRLALKTDGTVGFLLEWSLSPNYKEVATPNIVDGKWHHIAGVADFTNSSAQAQYIYLDGKLVDSQTWSTGTISSPDQNHYLNLRDSANTYNGLLDEARIYNYARNAKQIVSDMNAGHPSVGSPVGSPMGYWKFDDGAGTLAGNSGNQGAILNGVLTNMAAPATSTSGWSPSGKFNDALGFDGSDDYVSVADNSALDITGDITLSAWVRLPSLPSNYKEIMHKGSGSSNTDRSYNLGITNANKFRACIYVSGTETCATDTSIPDLNKWYFVSMTRVGSAISLYVNGVLKATATQAGSINNTSGILAIGRLGGVSAEYFSGIIDEPKVYNYGLTSSEVNLDYNRSSALVLGSLSDTSQLPGGGGSVASNSASAEYCVPGDSTACAPPKLRWDYEQTKTSTTIPDVSGNNNNGTATNGPAPVPGKPGSALQYSSSDTSYVRKSSPNNLPTIQGNKTITWWQKVNAINANNQNAVSMWLSSNARQGGYRGSNFGISESGGAFLVQATAAPTAGVWHFIAYTWDGTNHKLYIDGVLDNSTTTASSQTGTPTTFETGGFNGGGNETMDGAVDSVRVYDYARTPSQIVWDYNQGKPSGYWKMDECQGTSIYDSSGNNIVGTKNGSTTTGTCSTSSSFWGGASGNSTTNSGKYNYAPTFNRSNSDYVVMPTAKALQGTNGITLSLWAKANSFGGNRSPAGLFGSSSDKGYWMNIQNSGEPQFWISRDGSGQDDAPNTSRAMTIGRWHHLVGTYDGSTIKVYMDGVLVGSRSGVSGTIHTVTTSNAFAIARLGAVSSDYFDGQVDDVKVFNYAATQSQIRVIYNQGSAVRFGPITGAP